MIPHVLHQMWFDKKDPDQDLPSDPTLNKLYSKYAQSWIDRHPDFTYTRWTGKLIKELWEDPRLTLWKPFWDGHQGPHIEKCDVTRYAIMYLHGGIYADLDFYCEKGIESFLNRELFLVREPDEQITGGKNCIHNGLIGSRTGHPIWAELMTYIIEHYAKHDKVVFRTGPWAFQTFYENSVYQYQEVLDSCLFVLYVWGKRRISQRCLRDDITPYAWTKGVEGTGWDKDEHWLSEEGIIILVGIIIFFLIVVGWKLLK